ncbi:MAG TPA: hypothetical protein PK854_06080 [Oscillospiraceae bacterium]|nr:hypothetical protein [Oscillospiraceae bacterium]
MAAMSRAYFLIDSICAAGFAQIETSRETKRHALNRPHRAAKPEREVLTVI